MVLQSFALNDPNHKTRLIVVGNFCAVSHLKTGKLQKYGLCAKY